MTKVWQKLNQVDMEKSEELNFLDRKLGFFTCRAPNSERGNQDTIAFAEFNKDEGFLIVADGMGGYEGGEKASDIVASSLINLAKKNKEAPSFDEIQNLLSEAHTEIKKLSSSGTTLSLCHFKKNTIRFINAGDSPAYVLGSKGAPKYQVNLHSVPGFGVAAGLLSESELITHEQSHVIVNCLGHDEFYLEVSPWLNLAQSDIIVMASDGLNGALSYKEIVEHSLKGSAKERVQNLMEASFANMTSESSKAEPDDFSVLLLK